MKHFLFSPECVAKYDWLQTAGETLMKAALKNHAELAALSSGCLIWGYPQVADARQ